MDWDEHRREMDEHMREMRERMAESFGHVPEGQEHRAWVDHERLRAVDPTEDKHEWERMLGFLGLSQLDAKDPQLPEALRALLTCTEAPASSRRGSWTRTRRAPATTCALVTM